jgi:hypothetical protein
MMLFEPGDSPSSDEDMMPSKAGRCFYQLALIACLTVSTLLTTKAVGVSLMNEQSGAQEDREVAARFAPVFYQGLGEHARSDYITNFDFDGDWRGDNNWAHADDSRFKLRANIYYAVSETRTHYFIHYAVFHPRDYKGGDRGALLSEMIREGARRGGKYDPTGQLGEAALAHENDMEGCLVVVAKNGNDLQQARVVFVETMAHNKFLKYVTEAAQPGGFETISLEDERPRLYVEPKGHGIEAYREGEGQGHRNGILIYSFNGRADDPEQERRERIGYELLPLYTTLWPRSQRGVNETYGEAHDYGRVTISVVQKDGSQKESQIKLGTRGSSFLGAVGAANMARPPWGWFDRDERDLPPGEWFFDPARTIKRHFHRGEEFSIAYTYAPFLGIDRRK